jgi:multicomponent Na+:H+ antiporter subunit D
MLKIWNEVFWKKSYEDVNRLPRVRFGLLAPGAALVILSVALGLVAGPLVEYNTIAGQQLFDRAAYITAVCGADGCEAVYRAAVK